MSRFILIYLFFLFISSTPALLADDGELPVPVKAELVSDVSAVKPGSAFKVGVLFDIEPGWQIYWKNPGDSGLPTTVELAIPGEFKVGKPGWPLPSVFRGPGGATDFGYERSLLLITRVDAPPHLASGSTVNIYAKVFWVSCRDICIPGRAELGLDIPVSEVAKAANADLFSEWEARLPLSSSEGKSLYNIEVETDETEGDRTSVNILLHRGGDVRNIEFFPVPGISHVVDNIRIDSGSSAETSIISFDISRAAGQNPSPCYIETLAVLTGSDGRRSGIEIPVMLDCAD